VGVLPVALVTPLAEEQSKGYDAGIEYTSAGGVRAEITYFDHDVEDEISYRFDPGTFEDGYVQLAGTSESTGVEVGVDVPLGVRWAILANWTKNDSKTVTNAARLRRPEGLGNFGVRYVSANEALRFMASYRVSRDAVDLGNVPLDDYEVLDFSVSYETSEALQVYGRVQNMADATYQEVVGYNVAGRAVYGGVRVRF
jgi:vitamin B12 transporter